MDFFKTKAIRIEQPVGVFYSAAIPAETLLEVCFTDRLTAKRSGDGYVLDGSQRNLAEKRVKEIGKFLGSLEAGFPNSIILAANYGSETGFIEDSEAKRWKVEENRNDDECIDLIIPTSAKLAAIIDGQHRLFGFTKTSPEIRRMPVLCSIFFDLPKPYQAYLFATINSNQKQVDRSLTYELFGYNIEEEDESYWSPDKLAVFLARRLNTEIGSPFEGRILVAAQNNVVLSRAEARRKKIWMVSMATVVDGILRLISSKPKEDALELRPRKGARKRASLSNPVRRDNSPLRRLYVNTNDRVVYAAVKNFFSVAFELLGQNGDNADPDSYITKTIGIQALFDLLKALAADALHHADFSQDYFREKLNPIRQVDFSDEAFINSSGSGRTYLKQFLLFAVLGEEYDDEEKMQRFRQLLNP